MADPPDADKAQQRNFTVAASAAAAIFAALVGGNLLDSGNSAHPMWYVDQATIVLWLFVFFGLAFAVYSSPDVGTFQRRATWIFTAFVGLVTGAVIILSAANFTRDVDHGWLLLNRSGHKALQRICGSGVTKHPYGAIRTKTLQQEFVIFTFATTPTPSPFDRRNTEPKNTGCSDGVKIPRSDVIGIRVNP